MKVSKTFEEVHVGSSPTLSTSVKCEKVRKVSLTLNGSYMKVHE